MLPWGMSKKRDWLRQVAVHGAARLAWEAFGGAIMGSIAGIVAWLQVATADGLGRFFLFVVIVGGGAVFGQIVGNEITQRLHGRRTRNALPTGAIVRGDLSMTPPPTVTVTLGPVPESELIGLMDAVNFVEEKWSDVPRAKARQLVLRWWWKWKGDTTHRGMQDGRIVRQRFIQWVGEELDGEREQEADG